MRPPLPEHAPGSTASGTQYHGGIPTVLYLRIVHHVRNPTQAVEGGRGGRPPCEEGAWGEQGGAWQAREEAAVVPGVALSPEILEYPARK